MLAGNAHGQELRTCDFVCVTLAVFNMVVRGTSTKYFKQGNRCIRYSVGTKKHSRVVCMMRQLKNDHRCTTCKQTRNHRYADNRRFRIPRLAILRTADDTSLAIADDLLRCDRLGGLKVARTRLPSVGFRS